MSRLVSDWLSGYLEYTAGSEPPTSYHMWTGISVLAGALQRKTYLEWGFEKIYPNMYVILIGSSGRTRKGTALGIGKDLLSSRATIKMASESITKEALIRMMKGSVVNFKNPTTGATEFHCSITCFSEELSVFLGQGDIKFLSNLTDWYDSKDKWTYETKNMGTDKIEGVCFNLLGATAPDWLQSMLPQEALGGGFTSRVIFIVEDKKSKTVPKHEFSEREMEIRKGLIKDLEKISQLAGAFQFDAEGEELYTSWYSAEDAKLAKGELPVADERFASYAERRSTHIRKLSMVMSVSRSDELIIRAVDFKRALETLRAAELKMYKTFGGLGTAQYGQIAEKVFLYLQSRKMVKRSELVARFRRDMDMGALKIIEEMLEAMKVVRVIRDLQNNEVAYQWIGEEAK